MWHGPLFRANPAGQRIIPVLPRASPKPGDADRLLDGQPWAITYRNPGAMAPLGIPLHPTQIYEAILLGLLFAGL